jgi:hypothetical protein
VAEKLVRQVLYVRLREHGVVHSGDPSDIQAAEGKVAPS